MTTTTDNPGETTQAFERAYAGRVGREPWLQPIRDRAIQAFTQAGFPTVRDEDWKYTSLADFAARSAEYLNSDHGAAADEAVKNILEDLPIGPENHTLVFANGLFRKEWSTLPKDSAEISIETLRGATEPATGETWSRLGQYAEIERFQLAALNTAFLTDGLAIRVPDNAAVSRPVHIIFVSDGQKVGVQPRVLVDLGDNSRATLIEHHVGRGAGLANAVTEMHCAPGAHLRYVKIQEEDAGAHHLASQFVQLERDSRFDAVHVDLGGELARNDLSVRLAGTGARTNLLGLFVVDGKRHVDNHTRIDHLVEHTTSRETYRGILNDRGRGIFNGKIIVHAGADQTDAQLNNRNLLLTPTAEIDTKPELEIYTDDVKCGHGTTTGQIDKNEMFYLRSRGIPEDAARRMLLTAFANEIIDQIDGDDLSNYISNALAARLPG